MYKIKQKWCSFTCKTWIYVCRCVSQWKISGGSYYHVPYFLTWILLTLFMDSWTVFIINIFQLLHLFFSTTYFIYKICLYHIHIHQKKKKKMMIAYILIFFFYRFLQISLWGYWPFYNGMYVMASNWHQILTRYNIDISFPFEINWKIIKFNC